MLIPTPSIGILSKLMTQKSAIKFILRDVARNPCKGMKYQVKDSEGKVIKAGQTDGKGQFELTHGVGERLFLHLQPLEKGEMKFYREFTMQPKDGTVIWDTSLLLTKTTLKPEQEKGTYLRGTYEVKRGDTLTSIAKRYGTTVDMLMSLNKQIQNKHKISKGEILNVPPNKQTSNRDAERKTPPKANTEKHSTPSGTAKTAGAEKPTSSGSTLGNLPSWEDVSDAAEGAMSTIKKAYEQLPSAGDIGSAMSKGIDDLKRAGQEYVQKVLPQPVITKDSANENKNNVTVLTTECVCKKDNLIWGAKVSCAFRKKVVAIAARQNCDPNDLMAVMAVETGKTFLPHQLSGIYSNHPKQSDVTEVMVAKRAVGLIQFTRAAVAQLNETLKTQGKPEVTKYKLAKMSAVDQLDYVEMHIAYWRKAKKLMSTKLTLSDLYVSIFAPAHMGKAEGATLYSAGGDSYKANKSVDLNKDGKITKAELAKRATDLKAEGAANRSDYSEHAGGAATSPAATPATVSATQTKTTAATAAKSEGASVKSDCKDGCSVIISRGSAFAIKGLLYPLVVKATHAIDGMRMFGSGRNGGRKHAGVDLYAPTGTEVRAVADGKVVQVYAFYATTWAIEIEHEGFVVRYGEVSAKGIKVSEGQEVKRGQIIGKVGRLVGIKVPSDMLHFELYSSSLSPKQSPLTNSSKPYKRRNDLVDPTSTIKNMVFK